MGIIGCVKTGTWPCWKKIDSLMSITVVILWKT